MKNSILIASLIGVFVLVSNPISAQDSKNLIIEIETVTKSAIKTIKDNKSISDRDKGKFIQRAETILKMVQNENDENKRIRFEQEYKKLSDVYNRITGKTLPVSKKEKEEK